LRQKREVKKRKTEKNQTRKGNLPRVTVGNGRGLALFRKRGPESALKDRTGGIEEELDMADPHKEDRPIKTEERPGNGKKGRCSTSITGTELVWGGGSFWWSIEEKPAQKKN